MEAGLELRSSGRFGFLTVFEAAAAQLKASVDCESTGGLRWRLRFDAFIYAERVRSGPGRRPGS